jgi:hypothetical protein
MEEVKGLESSLDDVSAELGRVGYGLLSTVNELVVLVVAHRAEETLMGVLESQVEFLDVFQDLVFD